MYINPGCYLASIAHVSVERLNDKGVFRLVLEVTDAKYAGEVIELDFVYSGPSNKQNEWNRRLIKRLFVACRVPFKSVFEVEGLEGSTVIIKTSVWAGRPSAEDFIFYNPSLDNRKRPQPNPKKALSILDEHRDYGVTTDYEDRLK